MPEHPALFQFQRLVGLGTDGVDLRDPQRLWHIRHWDLER